MSVTLESTSPEVTRAVARRLAGELRVGDLILLLGDLGAGKTAFVQGLAQALGIADRVTSPTFALLHTFEGQVVLHHLDVYRLAGPAEAGDLDLPELAETGVTVIEWGDRLAAVLPDDRLDLRIEFGEGDDDRILIATGHGARGSELERVLEGVDA